MKRYINFITEGRKPVMRYYAYDWDDNLLMMPTVIHMEKLDGEQWVPVDVSTSEFAKVRNLENWRTTPTAYSNFRDGEGDFFMQDMLKAISTRSFGPSWKKFLECLISGSIFAIITARGHEPDTIRKGVEYIIWNILTPEDRDEMGANLTAFQEMFLPNYDILRQTSLQTLVSAYLDKCDFVGVSSPSFAKKFPGDAASPEKAKIAALNEFIERIKSYGQKVGGEIKLGFSDDDPRNVEKVHKHFGEIAPLYDDMTFSVFDTSDPKVQGGKKKR